MAILRSLGFRPNEVFLLYFGQTIVLGLAGSLLGVAEGRRPRGDPDPDRRSAPRGLGIGLWQPWSFLRGIGLGLSTALLFSFAPLAAVRRVPPLRVLRKDIEPLRASAWTRTITGVILLAGVTATAIIQAGSLRYGAAFTGALALAAGILALSAHGAMRLLARLPGESLRSAPVWVRHGLAALLRPGADTTGAVVALGLGVLLLLGVSLVQGGLSAQLSTALPSGSPSAFLIDIQKSQWPEVQEILARSGAESVNSAPVVTAASTASAAKTSIS